MASMASRPAPTTPAQRRRDDALGRVRRITVYTGMGAVAFTAAASLVAATTIPGRSTGSSNADAAPTTQPGDTGDNGGVPQDGGGVQPPQPGGGGVPAAVTGGS
jgi:hypothetical protein